MARRGAAAIPVIRAFLPLFFAICIALPVQAQESAGDEYEPYREDEFPQWMHDLRRAEVVLIGSFPVTLLLTTLAYEILRNVTTIGERSGFGNYDSTESKWLFVAGFSFSGFVATLDFYLQWRKRGAPEK